MDSLLYGKNQTKNIVALEVEDDKAELFIQNSDGSIISQWVDNKYWILCYKPLDKSWIKLKGDLHYKYGKQFKSREHFYSIKNKYKRSEDIFCINDPIESLMVKDGYTQFKKMRHKDVSILSFDIETTTLDHNDNAFIICISNTYRDSKGNIERKLFTYDEYPDQGTMLCCWKLWVQAVNPTIICGHNINSFDLPYMQYIADRENITLNLGRDNSPLKFNNYESKFRIDGSRTQAYKKCHIYGRHIIDTYFLSIKYDVGRKYESYGLKNIIAQEKLEVKDRQFYDASLIRHNYTDPVEWPKIKQYAIHDADDALALYDLMSPPLFYFCQSVPKSYQSLIESATGSQLNAILIRSYLQEGHSLPQASDIKNFPGAISYGSPGVYKNCLKWDVASLYPSIILEYEVCNIKKDPNMNFLKMVEYFTKERLKNKKLAKETNDKYYKDLEQSQKIGINSAYGMLGAKGLLFNYLEGAKFITETGREILQHSILWATGSHLENAHIEDTVEFEEENA